MSKLNVNEIEATSTNSNVKVVGKGTGGACEIKGATNDGTLRLNCSAQSHGVKLKAPSDSAGQNYTMTLPDNQIAANKLLKVKSITGSGSSAVGQLEFADQPNVDLTTLNAANITTGTIPSARFPTNIDAENGSVLQLISNTILTTNSLYIAFSLDANSVYKVVGKDLRFTSDIETLYVSSLDNRGWSFLNHAANGSSGMTAQQSYNSVQMYMRHTVSNTYLGDQMNFTGEIGTVAGHVYFKSHGFASNQLYSFTKLHGFSRSGNGLTTIKFQPNTGNFATGTQMLLYKYKT